MADKTTNPKLNVNLTKVDNGYLVEFTPTLPTTLFENVIQGLSENQTEKWNEEEKQDGMNVLFSSFKEIATASKESKPVTMVYSFKEIERMMDDIKNFVETNVPPAVGIPESKTK